MSVRLTHHACFSTSEDHEHPAKELDQQGPHSRGWKSRQFCIYPQELVFQLSDRAHVDRIQVLTHQLMIPEKIEFHIGDVARGQEATCANARFTRLGTVGLSANHESGHAAREFKAVRVDCEGQFVKLVVHRNHMSKSNRFNQVCLMGINFLGQEIETNNNTVKEDSANKARLANYDDLSFNMYVDHDCVKYMQKLEARKEFAAKNERFEYAKNCKDAIGLLHMAGLRLGKYHIEKRMAIEEESYDKAKLKKDHAEEYKESVMEALKVDQLLESDGTEPKNNSSLKLELPPPPGKKRRSPSPSPPTPPPRPRSDPLPPIARSPEPPPVSAPKPLTPPPPIYTLYGTSSGPSTPPTRIRTPPPAPLYRAASQAASPLPPRHARSPLFGHQPPISKRKLMAGMMVGDVGSTASRQMSMLNDQDRKAAALPIEVFGESLVENFYSKSFVQKEEGFRELMADLKGGMGDFKADKKTRAATLLLLRGLKDKMYTVSQQAVETLAYLVGPFATQHKTSKRELSNTMEAVLPELVQKLGENATRVQTMASESLLQLVATAHARRMPDVVAVVAAPLRGAVQPRVALARIDIVEKVVVKYGVTDDDGPQSTRRLVEFAVSAMEQPGEQLRGAGCRLLLLLYPEDRQLVRQLVARKDKNHTFRSLRAELDRLDGKRGTVASLRLDSPVQLVTVPEEPEPGHTEPAQPQLSRSLRSKSMASIVESTPTAPPADGERTCTFCGTTDDNFATEEGMEYHFWKICPMLTRCPSCKQAVEVSAFTEHLLRDCKDRRNFKCCTRCQEAVPKADFDYHVRSYQCIPAKSGPAGNHCPLCHQNTAPYDDGWKQHLVDDCTENKRNARGLSRAGRRQSVTPAAATATATAAAAAAASRRPSVEQRASRGRIQTELHSRRRASVDGAATPAAAPTTPAPRRRHSDAGSDSTPPSRSVPGGAAPPPSRSVPRRGVPGAAAPRRTTPPAGDRAGRTPPGRVHPNRTPAGHRQPAKTPAAAQKPARTPPSTTAPSRGRPDKKAAAPARRRSSLPVRVGRPARERGRPTDRSGGGAGGGGGLEAPVASRRGRSHSTGRRQSRK